MSNPCNVEGVHYPPSICPPHQGTTAVPPAGTAVTGADLTVTVGWGAGFLGAALVAAVASRTISKRGRARS